MTEDRSGDTFASLMKVRKFCLIATERTGSSFLRQVLQRFPKVACHSELFNSRPGPDCVHQKYVDLTLTAAEMAERDADPLRFLSRVEQQSLERAEMCGFKLMISHQPTVLEHVLSSDEYKVIVISRENRLAQYSSEAIARKTDIWGRVTVSQGSPQVQIIFDKAEFKKYCEKLSSSYDLVTHRLEDTNRAFSLKYHQILDERAIEELLSFLGVDPDRSIGELLGRASLVKQNTSNILDRFSNPDDAIAAMREMGREDWLQERVS